MAYVKSSAETRLTITAAYHKLTGMRPGKILGHQTVYRDLSTTADTLKQAQGLLEVKIGNACENWAPYTETFHTADLEGSMPTETIYTAFVYRLVESWAYKIVSTRLLPQDGTETHVTTIDFHPKETGTTAIHSCLYHLAQMMFRPSNQARRMYCESIFIKHMAHRQLREFTSWANWQDSFARLKAQGHNEDYCHQHAAQEAAQ